MFLFAQGGENTRAARAGVRMRAIKEGGSKYVKTYTGNGGTKSLKPLKAPDNGESVCWVEKTRESPEKKHKEIR